MIRSFLWAKRSNGAARSGPGLIRRALQFPIPMPSRVAVLSGGFESARGIREFDPDERDALYQWAPEAIVAPLEVALSLADQRLRGLADLPSLRSALVILTSIDGEPLADDYREFLWQSFGVPVFEQMRGLDGSVWARECEVHDGLHLDPDAKVTPEMGACLVTGICECGAETPRLKGHTITKIPSSFTTWGDREPVARHVA